MKDALFNELMESVEQMDEIKKGERAPARERFVASSLAAIRSVADGVSLHN